MQVVRHERASVKADMWSYGILVWELISEQDITNLQPLAIALAMKVCLFLASACCLHVTSYIMMFTWGATLSPPLHHLALSFCLFSCAGDSD